MEINITNKKGIKLLTKGHKVEEDIIVSVDSSLLPSGELTVTENGTYDVYNKETVNVNVPIPDGYVKPTGELDITANGTYDVTDKATANVNVPIPEGYIQPTGALDITENGTHDVTDKASVNVNVESSGVADTVDKEITIGYTHSSSSSAYAHVHTNFGEFYIQAGTSQTIRVVGILGIEFDGAHKFINSDDGTINHITHFDGIRYFAIKNTTNSISIVTDNSGGGSNN